MRLYEIVLKPETAFGTPLVGDTLFGQFCWQVWYQPNLVSQPFDQLLASYPSRPFVVFSSAWPRWQEHGRTWYALPRPTLPRSSWFEPAVLAAGLNCREKVRQRPDKELKKKRWLLVSDDLQLDYRRLLSERELWDRVIGSLPRATPLYRQLYRSAVQQIQVTQGQPHNTIHRWHNRTGQDPCRPYTLDVLFYCPGLTLAIFVLVDGQVTDIEKVCRGLARIGQTGFGRDASSGLGRFQVIEAREIQRPAPLPGSAVYTLAPSVPVAGSYVRAYYQPMVRFGRHGDRLATSRNPFKAPVVMAAAGAIFVPTQAEYLSKPWWGRAVTGVSKIQTNTMVQGFSPFLPLPLEVGHA
ncbi:MAG: type III-A CRISPR-associated RAMP protein Csm4 [Desulfobacca sp.]|uniref:type III-A CRISPR-associated RAMP protein Csm4 n=1 Tax=Desulfobacca sp. TaxID=2067990 RepID=UPI00404AA7CF